MRKTLKIRLKAEKGNDRCGIIRINSFFYKDNVNLLWAI